MMDLLRSVTHFFGPSAMPQSPPRSHAATAASPRQTLAIHDKSRADTSASLRHAVRQPHAGTQADRSTGTGKRPVHGQQTLPGRCGINHSTDVAVRNKDSACRSVFRQWYSFKSEPTLQECVQRCISCRECHFATFSRSLSDCSLYRTCSINHLAPGHGYYTVAVTRHNLSAALGAHVVARASKSETKPGPGLHGEPPSIHPRSCKLCVHSQYAAHLKLRPQVQSANNSTGDLLARCGVASVAIYFPNFHRSVDNSMLWGENWTEWDNLRAHDNELDGYTNTTLLHPWRGYYNIADDGRTLREQAEEARRGGFKAFMFYHYWFEHGRTALSQPLERTLLSSGGLGFPYFFSWANEGWERRWVSRSSRRSETNSENPGALIAQKYGGPASWEAHIEWLARFFRQPDYVRIEGRPVIVVYEAHHIVVSQGHFRRPDACWKSNGKTECGEATPFGCAGAEQYMTWYPHLRLKHVSVRSAYQYHTKHGESEGYTWPMSDPCNTILSEMVDVWQQHARRLGFPGLYVVTTMGHVQRAQEIASYARNRVAAAFSFLPTSLQPNQWHWDIKEKCTGIRVGPTITASCQCYLGHLIREADALEHSYRPNFSWAPRRLWRGAFMGWSNYPRFGPSLHGKAFCHQPSAQRFSELVSSQLLRALSDVGGAQACAQRLALPNEAQVGESWQNLLIVNAWNEWGEQAVIEPSLEYGDEALRAHLSGVERIERRVRVELAKLRGFRE